MTMHKMDCFEVDGYCLLNLENINAILSTRNELMNELKTITGCKDITLENYHTIVGDDGR